MIELVKICKSFGSHSVLQEISLQIPFGTIHGLVGENGAGKSTLMKILYGLLSPDSGDIRIAGQIHKFSSTLQARQLGLGMVQQHFVLAEEHTALENMLFAETDPTKPWSLLRPEQRQQQYEKVATELGFKIPWRRLVSEMSVGEQQRLEVFKILYHQAKILILDEPTAILSPQEVDEFFKNLLRLKEKGRTIILITHKLKEVLRICDNITVIRKGRSLATLKPAQTSESQLAELMVGRQLSSKTTVVKKTSTTPVKVASLEGTGRMDLDVHAGEVIGVVGVEGNGQSELIARFLQPSEFSDPKVRVTINSQEVTHKSTFWIRQNLSFAVFPEDRFKDGMAAAATAFENFLLGSTRNSFFKNKSGVEKILQDFQVDPLNLDLPLKNFSGGNQQKLVVARELQGSPQFILAAHPTRGVDVGSAELIHERLRQAQENGAGILLISSDLEEIYKLSQRIFVIYKSRFVLEEKQSPFSESKIGCAMGGVLT